VGERQEQQGW